MAYHHHARHDGVVLLEENGSDMYQHPDRHDGYRPGVPTYPGRRTSIDSLGSADWYQPHSGYPYQPPTAGAAKFPTRTPAMENGGNADWYPQQTSRSHHEPDAALMLSSLAPTAESKGRPTGYTIASSVVSGNTAIQPGGTVDIFTWGFIGYAYNWLLIGITNGMIQALVFPVFSTYLHYEPYRVGAVSALLDFAWYFKFVLGFITDCFPINRYRRKPYIYIGWTVFAIVMIALTCLGSVDPYKIDGQIVHENAPAQGKRYVIPLMVASFAVGLVTVASEGMMVEFSHREPMKERGKVQCKSMFMRYVGTCIGTGITTFGFNGPEYGGSFDASVSLPVLFGFLIVFSISGLVMTYFFFEELPTRFTKQPLISQLLRVWRILQMRPSWQIMCYGFAQAMAMNYRVVEATAILKDWLGADSVVLNFAHVFTGFGGAIAMLLASKYWLNRDWRNFVLVLLAISVVLEVPTELVTIFDVVRSIYFYYVVEHIQWVLDALIMLPPLLVLVEIAEPGFEAVTYGTIATVFRLAFPVVTTITNLMSTSIHHHVKDLADDTAEIRWHVACETLFQYALRVGLIMATIVLLPRQKRHVQELNAYGNASLVIPVAIFVVVLMLFIAAVTSNLMAVFESTSCYRFAGGQGC